MNPTQQSILVGVILGAGLGALGGYLFGRGLDDPDDNESLKVAAQSVRASDAIKIIISIMGVLRGISSLRGAG